MKLWHFLSFFVSLTLWFPLSWECWLFTFSLRCPPFAAFTSMLIMHLPSSLLCCLVPSLQVLTFILQSSAELLCNYSSMVAEQNIFLPWCNSVCLDSARTSESLPLASPWQQEKTFLSGAAWLEWKRLVFCLMTVYLSSWGQFFGICRSV